MYTYEERRENGSKGGKMSGGNFKNNNRASEAAKKRWDAYREQKRKEAKQEFESKSDKFVDGDKSYEEIG